MVATLDRLFYEFDKSKFRIECILLYIFLMCLTFIVVEIEAVGLGWVGPGCAASLF